MASNRTVSFVVVKNFLLLVSFFLLAGSIYVSYASWKSLDLFELKVSQNYYGLQYQGVNIWRFITVVTIALQDFSALFGIFGTYTESFEITLTYAIIMAVVFVLNLINPSLMPTIVGPVFAVCVSIIAFIFTRFLRNVEYEINDKRAMSKV